VVMSSHNKLVIIAFNFFYTLFHDSTTIKRPDGTKVNYNSSFRSLYRYDMEPNMEYS
jgi:hypothetical protein